MKKKKADDLSLAEHHFPGMSHHVIWPYSPRIFSTCVYFYTIIIDLHMIYTFQYNHHDYMLYLWAISPRVSRSCFYTRDVKPQNKETYNTKVLFCKRES